MRFSACLSLITLVATPLVAQRAPGQLPLPRLDARKASRPLATTADTSRTGPLTEAERDLRRRYPGLPVVLTASYSHVLAERGRHGFELLHKPYAAEELSRVLRRLTRGRPARNPDHPPN